MGSNRGRLFAEKRGGQAPWNLATQEAAREKRKHKACLGWGDFKASWTNLALARSCLKIKVNNMLGM